MVQLKVICLSLLLCCLFSWSPVQGLAVMSVDFGSEWMKIGIVSVREKSNVFFNSSTRYLLF